MFITVPNTISISAPEIMTITSIGTFPASYFTTTAGTFQTSDFSFFRGVIVNDNLTVADNLIVTGSAFIGYITSSNITIQSDSTINLDGGIIEKTNFVTPLNIAPNYNVLDDDMVLFVGAGAGASTKTITLPTISAANDGRIIRVVKIDVSANAVQLVRSSTDTINGATTLTANGQYESITIIANNNAGVWHVLSEYPAGSWI